MIFDFLTFGFRTVLNHGKIRKYGNVEKSGVPHVQIFKILDLERSYIMEKLENHENIEKLGVQHGCLLDSAACE